LFGLSAPGPAGGIPANVYPRQDPFPGLQEDRWDYEAMKKQALLYGSYYALERDGLLYQNGRVEPGLGRTADEVFGSEAAGDHHGLVFVDTLDRRPPGTDNLGTLSLETEYAEGLFVVNAHLRLKPKGSGKSVPVLSPPGEGLSSLEVGFPSSSPVSISKACYTRRAISRSKGGQECTALWSWEGKWRKLLKYLASLKFGTIMDCEAGSFKACPWCMSRRGPGSSGTEAQRILLESTSCIECPAVGWTARPWLQYN